MICLDDTFEIIHDFEKFLHLSSLWGGMYDAVGEDISLFIVELDDREANIGRSGINSEDDRHSEERNNVICFLPFLIEV